MASEDQPHSDLAAMDSVNLTAQDNKTLTAHEAGHLKIQGTGVLTSQGTGNTDPVKPTNEKPKKQPPKKPIILKNCKLCNVILTSQCIVDAHMASKKHAKKVQAAESMKAILGQKKVVATNLSQFRCDICNIFLNSEQQKDLHLSGTKHKFKVQKSAKANVMLLENNTTSGASTGIKREQIVNQPAEGVTTETDPSIAVQAADLKCTVCNIIVNSVQQLTQHLSSKKHQLKENSAKRQTPFNRPRRGGMGRGGPGSSQMPRASGALGARGRGQGRSQGPPRGGPTRGRGLSGGVNSLNSNFASGGFALNFQGMGGPQSLKRERSDSTFGTGSSDDVSNSSYYQGNKIPRGAQSGAFDSMDSMDSIAFRSGNNAFGGGNIFGAENTAFSGEKTAFGFGRGSLSPRGGNQLFGRGNKPFGAGNNAFGGGNNSFGCSNNSFEEESNFFGVQSNSYGGGNASFRDGNSSLYGGGNSLFGGGSTSFGGGNSSFGNSSFGDGNSSFVGGKVSYGQGEGSFGAGQNFGDYNNFLRSGSGRGNSRGGFERGRGFGHRGGFGNTVQESGF